MIITQWTKCPIDTGNKQIWMINTPTNHGAVTRIPLPQSLGAEQTQSLIAGRTTISPRRYSVVELEDNTFTAVLGAISYPTGYDTFNEPLEIFEQYLKGNYESLMKHSKVYSTEPPNWDGSSQELMTIFGL